MPFLLKNTESFTKQQQKEIQTETLQKALLGNLIYSGFYRKINFFVSVYNFQQSAFNLDICYRLLEDNVAN